jgi:hypothetical protein
MEQYERKMVPYHWYRESKLSLEREILHVTISPPMMNDVNDTTHLDQTTSIGRRSLLGGSTSRLR